MFAAAYRLASGFTRPVVISTQLVNGKCSSGIGAFVVVNRDGWVVTAWHILEQIQAQEKSCSEIKNYRAARLAIESDGQLGTKEKKRRLQRLGQPNPKAASAVSTWWSWNGVKAVEYAAVPVCDFAMVRLQPFDPSWVTTYPVFKDPTRQFDPGTSVCRLGYPFHSIEPIYHADKNAFELPPGALPLPQFPIDGIVTRFVEVAVPKPPKYPLLYVETSSPGLKGQSGGPIFDTRGAVWGIQSKTQHYPLGFNPEVPGEHAREHQFLNVGWGVHAATIVGALNERGITFQLSEY